MIILVQGGVVIERAALVRRRGNTKALPTHQIHKTQQRDQYCDQCYAFHKPTIKLMTLYRKSLCLCVPTPTSGRMKSNYPQKDSKHCVSCSNLK